MEKQLLYKRITPYKCKRCGEEMLFFETARNTLIDYKAYLNAAKSLSEMTEDLGKRKIRFFKCICCGSSFIIDWSKGWPEQVTDINILRKFGV